jgi:hypothetical protein
MKAAFIVMLFSWSFPLCARHWLIESDRSSVTFGFVLGRGETEKSAISGLNNSATRYCDGRAKLVLAREQQSVEYVQDQVDLSPAMALADFWAGGQSKLAESYRRPQPREIIVRWILVRYECQDF